MNGLSTMWRNRTVLCIGLLLMIGGTAFGQADAYVKVETNVPGSRLYADARYVGVVKSRVLAIPAGEVTLALVPPTSSSWLLVRPDTTLLLVAGDTVSVELTYDYVYRIESTPFGAFVREEGPNGPITLGETPLVFRRKHPVRSVLRVEKQGFQPERILPEPNVVNQYAVSLKPQVEQVESIEPVAWRLRPSRKQRWINLTIAGATVAAGAVAVHYKMKADRLYDRYEDTTDPELRPNIKRYDTYSAIALGGMQVGVGVFALRLVLR